jgi:NAD(P)-dependent dehydrogenase (short-subunit alcohol dehydrogenase family)
MNKTNSRVALVTGASSGIGKATANALMTAGYRVFGTSRRAAAETPGRITMLTCDVTDDESVAKLIESVLADAGRIDLLVNNAGMAPRAHIILGWADNNLKAHCAALAITLHEYEWDRSLMLQRTPAIIEGLIRIVIEHTAITIRNATACVVGQGTIGAVLIIFDILFTHKNSAPA